MLPLVEVDASTPRERGRQYGEQAREQIAVSVDFYRREFEDRSGLAWEEVRSRTPRWVPLIEAFHADALEEVRGISDGSGFAFEEILALNGRGELRAGDPFGSERPAEGGSAAREPDAVNWEGCTSFSLTQGAAGDGHVYCGQNWDWRVGTKESVVMLRIRQPPKPTIVMQVEAGQVGRHGANSAGIGVNANGLEAPFGFRLAVPQPYIRRRILDSMTMHDAIAAVMEATQSVCTNLVFTHRDGFAVDLETTPGRHGVMEPTDGVLTHANAFLAYMPPEIAESYRPSSFDSLYRAPRVASALRRARAATSTAGVRDVIEAALADHFSFPNSVCTHPDPRNGNRWQTVASAYADLTTGEYLVAPGNPCEHPFKPLPWNLYA